MLYFFLKPLVKVALKVYFRNIYFSGKENIPDNKAFIIAMNHPSAFLEPVIMAVNIKKPVHFLVRGDHFNKLFYRFLLKQGKMIPVFRQKESGFGSLKNNYDTFSRCYQHIANGDIIALFPEGRTENEKRLRPLQRGIARIAFGTLFNYPEMQDLFVLPVSVNYTEPLIFRGTAYLHVGNPLSVKDYINSEQVPDYHQLLIDLAVELKKNMIIIENESDENLVEFCLMMTRNLNSYSFLPVYNNHDGRLRLEQKVSHFWNYHASEELKFETLKKIDAYQTILKNRSIDDKVVSTKDYHLGYLSLGIFIIISFLGSVFASPPVIFAEWITKTKVKHPSFISPVRFGAGFGGFLIYAILLCLIAWFWNIWVLPAAILAGFMAYFSLYFKERQALYKSYLNFQRLNEAEKNRLILLKKEILSSFN